MRSTLRPTLLLPPWVNDVRGQSCPVKGTHLKQGYYDSLGQADQQGDLEPFVVYQLEAIHDALLSEVSSEIPAEKASEIGAPAGSAVDEQILWDLAAEPTLSARRLAERLQLSQRTVENHLAALQRQGRLLRHGSPRAGTWQVL